MAPSHKLFAPGPFRAEHLKEGSPYELSNGHAILCLPSGRRGGRSNLIGGEVLETDPAVKSAGVDVGFSAGSGDLRAPDIAVGDFPNEPGWAKGVPPLAVEYADTGQDEGELQAKISELLAAGTKHIWVVRLVGPRRVEIHEPKKKMRLARSGDELRAPGILKNPVPVDALFDREVAHEATLRNLLQRRGYESLEAVVQQAETRGEARGEAHGRAVGGLEALREALSTVLEARGIKPSAEQQRRVASATDPAELQAWLTRAATAADADEVFTKQPARAPSARRRATKKRAAPKR